MCLGPPSFLVQFYGSIIISGEDVLYVLDPANGRETGSVKIGGRMGIISPTIVGGTAYLANTWDWIVAVPVGNFVKP